MQWTDPSLAGAVRAKGERKSRPDKPALVVVGKQRLLDTHCGKPISTLVADHCRCSIWDRGKVDV